MSSTSTSDKAAALQAIQLNHEFNFHRDNAYAATHLKTPTAQFEAGDSSQWKHWPSKESTMETLLQAAFKAGVEASHIEVKAPQNKPRGVFATSTFKKNETIIKIPLSAMMQIEPNVARFNFKANQYRGRLIDNIMSSKPHQELVDLYIDTLPDDFNESLFHFNDVFLRTSHFGKRVALNLQWFKNLYLHQQDTAGISFDELVWTAMIVCSRQFTLNGQHYLVPIADLLNHCEARHNCRFYFNEQEKAMHFVALRKIKAGEELIHLYEEEMTTASALLGYGMMPSRKVSKQRADVHYIFNRKLYHLTGKPGQSLLPIVLDLYFQNKDHIKNQSKRNLLNMLYMRIKQDLDQQIAMRMRDKNQAIAAASSDWEEHIIQFIFDQESETYTKLSQLLTYLINPKMKLKPQHSSLKRVVSQFEQVLTRFTG